MDAAAPKARRASRFLPFVAALVVAGAFSGPAWADALPTASPPTLTSAEAAPATTPPTPVQKPAHRLTARARAPHVAPAQWASATFARLPSSAPVSQAQPASAPRAPAAPERRAPGPLPGPTGAPAFGSASSVGGSAVLIALLLGFVLAIPNAGRWLRPTLARGLSPVTLSPPPPPGSSAP